MPDLSLFFFQHLAHSRCQILTERYKCLLVVSETPVEYTSGQPSMMTSLPAPMSWAGEPGLTMAVKLISSFHWLSSKGLILLSSDHISMNMEVPSQMVDQPA